MASIMIHNLDYEVKARLQLRAVAYGRSMECAKRSRPTPGRTIWARPFASVSRPCAVWTR